MMGGLINDQLETRLGNNLFVDVVGFLVIKRGIGLQKVRGPSQKELKSEKLTVLSEGPSIFPCEYIFSADN
jgi:hypothetical protein